MNSDDEIMDSTRYSRDERIRKSLKILRDGRISLLDLILHILQSDKAEFATYQDRFFTNPSGKLNKLLDSLFVDKRGRAVFLAWMEPHAIELVSDKIASEMDKIKSALAWSINTTTPDSLLTWDVDAFIGPLVDTSAPILGHVLRAAAQTKRAKEHNKIKSCITACNVIVTQLAKERSQQAQFFAIPFTLFLWTNGASRQTIEALHKCGLCISFSSLTKLLKQLASESLERARHVARGLHVLCWDNINIKTSIFVEQRDSAPAKVQSGTFAILYEITADPVDLQLSPMLERGQRASDLVFQADVRPTAEQRRSFHDQLRIHIVDILLACCSSFHTYQRPVGPTLQHPKRREMPAGHRTKQFPLRTSTIEENSVSGNIAVVNDVYINQLKMTHEESSIRAVPSINDQSTNARIRGAKALRTKDINPFTRLQFLQLGFGLFHLTMNLIWALLHVHRGSINQVGSLSHFFAVLDRTRLGCEHPDYHTLLSTLLQILRGIIVNAWKVECGYPSLMAFASSDPSPGNLLCIAEKIIQNHASSSPTPSNLKQKKTMTASDSTPMGSSATSSHDDQARRNLCLLTRDLLYVLELTEAIPTGDFGRVEDILGSLAMIFRGAGSNNYSTEILHWIYNIKNIWTPKFADIMRDHMLVNMSGLEGHWMPIDLNIEHLIKFLKLFFAAKGVYASWDRLGDISASVDLLQNVRKQVGRALKTAYHGNTHINPDVSAAIHKVAYKISELELHKVKADRSENSTVKPVIDTLALGEQKLKSSTIATFNKKIRGLMAGESFEIEEDELPPAAFDLTGDSESMD